MNHLRKKYRILIISALFILGFIISAVYRIAMDKIEKNNYAMVRESIIDTKKLYIKDIVNNVINSIEQKKKNLIQYYGLYADHMEQSFINFNASNKDSFVNSSIELSNNTDRFFVYILDNKTNKIQYSSPGISPSSDTLMEDEIKTIQSSSLIFRELNFEEYHIVFYLEEETIDKSIKKQLYDEIHNFNFSNEAYIWVNEIIDYDGGDNYAIRLIHPYMKETEGSFLSTNATDIKGNHPYAEELKGVKEHGELFFNYFFQKQNSSVISEKISYGKLYEKYNWVIAMGVHLDDITDFIEQESESNEAYINKIILTISILIFFTIAIVLIFVTLLEKWYFKSTNEITNDKIYKDSLTGAYNRRGAEASLKTAFSNFKKTNENAAIIMFDIDDFKSVNDNCGHGIGDFILQQTVAILNRHIRNTDILCRWGGDEFVLICNGLKEEDSLAFSNKLNTKISEFKFECNNHSNRQFTISTGISYFSSTDTDFLSSVKRADQALYCSKGEGKNCVTLDSSVKR